MPAYNFKEKFAPMVRCGEKCSTIRKRRKHPTLRGDTLQLYTGLRTLHCKKLLDVTCTSVTHISILPDFELVVLNGKDSLGTREIEALARQDGFCSPDDFFTFFSSLYSPDELATQMEIIKW